MTSSRAKSHLTLVPSESAREEAAPENWAAALRAVVEGGDREAFGRLFGHFAPRVKSYLIRTGSDEAQAEELAQEALVTVWRKAALFDPAQAAVSTWIFTIAKRLRIDASRRRRPEDSGDEGFEFDHLAAEPHDAGDTLDASRLAARLHDAMRRLPAEQAQVLQLSFYGDEPHPRIAAALGIPLGTVKSRVRLAVAQLRRLLDA